MASTLPQLYLFGGDKSWSSEEWTSSDDTVRGGSSFSHLDCTPTSPVAVFNGNLDIETLGGAGFASQRTTGEDKVWDLSNYDGLEIQITKSDEKHYTFILKDELLPKSPDGREQSSVSWEYDFKVETEDIQSGPAKVFIAWDALNATYRGREQKDAKPLDLANIKRFSIMMRSFFGTQKGDFSISILSIAATKNCSQSASDRAGLFTKPYRDEPEAIQGEKDEWENDSDSDTLEARRCFGSCVIS